MKNFLQIFLLTLSLIGASMTHSADIVSDDSIESNQTVSIQKKSFIDHIKQFITEHRTVALSIAGTVVVVSAATIDHLFLNGAVRTALKNGLVAIMPFLPKETTKSKEINDQSWTTGQKVGAAVATAAGISGIVYTVKKTKIKPELPNQTSLLNSESTLPAGCRNNASKKELLAGDRELELAEITRREKIALFKADQLFPKSGSHQLWSKTTLKNMEALGYPRMHHLTEESIERAFTKRLAEYPERKEALIQARDGLFELLFAWKLLVKNRLI